MTINEQAMEVLKTMTGTEKEFDSLMKGSNALLKENTKLKEKIEWLQHSWVPTSERLPNEKEFMRNYSRDNHSTEFVVMIEGADLPTVLRYTSDGFWMDESGNYYRVVAWMELPDPWKGDLE